MTHPNDAVPDKVGPYHILRVVGRGGMGVVYEAEQRKPMRRRVALKMMLAGLEDDEVLGRFDAERQALAVMDHPGIATVLDAGSTDDGRPYFVMEFVRGVPIDAFCDHHRLSIAERVALFARVSDAVQHAHLKGVIHRDLKPTNVLVSETGDAATPKIIDFGVAKATGVSLSDRAYVTSHGQGLGTLAYMSPEQAEGSDLDVDTRADIYSLGVMLHELLVGVVPLDPLVVGTPSFMADLIERDRTLPGLSRSAEQLDPIRFQEVARKRATDPAGLQRALKGDLEWVVGRAVEKDRARRYATAAELSADLRRVLRDEPVDARPPSRTYKLRKFARRHRPAVGAAVVASVAVIGGALSTTLGMVRARVAEGEARMEAATAEKVIDFMVELFDVASPEEAQGRTVTAREILDRGAEQLEEQLSDQPRVHTRLMTTIGRVYQELGLYPESQRLLEDAVRLADTTSAVGPAQQVPALNALGSVYDEQGRYAEAEEQFRRVLDLLGGGERPSPELAQTLNNLGLLMSRRDRYDEAEALYLQALRMNEQVLGTDALETSHNLGNLAVLYRKVGRLDEAEAMQRRTLDIARTTVGTDHPTYTTRLVNLGALYREMERPDDAEAVFLEALEIDERVLGPEHPYIAIDLSNLATIYLLQGRADEAEPLVQRMLVIDREALGPEAPAIGDDLSVLASVQVARGDVDGALTSLAETVRIYEVAFGAEHPRVGRAALTRGALLLDHGRFGEAESDVHRAVAILGASPHFAEHPSRIGGLRLAGVIAAKLGRPAEAESRFLEAIAIGERALGPTHDAVAEARTSYVAFLESEGREAEARELRHRRGAALEGA